MVERKHQLRLRDIKRHAFAGVALTAIATILSSCSALDPDGDPLAAFQLADQSSPLLRPASPERVDTGMTPAADGRVAGVPLDLVARHHDDWVANTGRPAPVDIEHSAPGESLQQEGPSEELADTVQLAERPSGESPQLLNAEGLAWLTVAQNQPVAAEPAVSEPARIRSAGRPDRLLELADDTIDTERAVEEPSVLLFAERPDWLVGMQDGPVVDERTVGDPMPLLVMTDGPDWLTGWQDEPVVAERSVGDPMPLLVADRPDWLMGWQDEPVTTTLSSDDSYPLVLSDATYHWPELAGPTEMASASCISSDAQDSANSRCTGWDDQIALADSVVGDEALSDMRGGFITAGGFQIDFGYYIETLVDGVTQLTSNLTLSDMMAGQTADIPVVGSITLAGSDGTSTVIDHNLSAAEVIATIENTQSNINVSTVATLAIEVIDLRNVQIGRASNTLQRMPMELQQSIIRGLQ